jgi:hypothetical protein
MIKTIKDGGTNQIRYGADPTIPNSSAHSMRIIGSFIEGGEIIFELKDTNNPNVPTYVNTKSMKLYTTYYDKKEKVNIKIYSKRKVRSYLSIKNKKAN